MQTAPCPDARTWAEIDLAALRHNAEVALEKAGPQAKLMAVVKADAYGHGAEQCALALADLATMFGVANVTEGVALREVLPEARVFILGPALPSEREEIVRRGFVPAISSAAEAAEYAKCGEVTVHAAIDTGMGRMGIWHEEAAAEVVAIRAMPGVRLEGIATHCPVPDEDAAFTGAELEIFNQLAAATGVPVAHALNSAGILGFSRHAGQMIRAGLMLYGPSPLTEWQELLRPVLDWKARVALVRQVGAGRSISYGRTFITPHPMQVVTLSVGYADGFPRALAGRGTCVLIGGKRCAVLGRVTMDLIMVDATGLDVKEGDEAVLIGRQGDEVILAGELAERAGTIPWEILTGIQNRVQRRYANDVSNRL